MEKEIEVKFLQVDIGRVREKLEKAGAVLKVPMRMMRRAMVKTHEMYENESFLRIRDEGDKVTMTYKQFDANAVDGCRELEITVSDFDKAVLLTRLIGMPQATYQESKRETWEMDGVEIVIDEWPWIKPYIEIEGKSESALRAAAAKLGFDWRAAIFGSVMRAYEAEYPVILKTGFLISDLSETRFGADIPVQLTGNK
ncbi:MAG: CYTH domain-containing protein [Lactobacillales bacterium]|jgi:adenylate cyclase class 2|nr:CYTH domain-containing protein [Lactobacillales bacterium]